MGRQQPASAGTSPMTKLFQEAMDSRHNSADTDNDWDAWQPWPEDKGPMLRSSSFTATQLYYLTPRAVYLESRKIFIGDFPAGWVEQNCEPWMEAVSRDILRNAAKPSTYDSPPSTVTPEPSPTTVPGIDEVTARRIADVRLATDLATTTDRVMHERLQRRARLIEDVRRRRFDFRDKVLTVASSEPSAIPANSLLAPEKRHVTRALKPSRLIPEGAEARADLRHALELQNYEGTTGARLVAELKNVLSLGTDVPKLVVNGEDSVLPPAGRALEGDGISVSEGAARGDDESRRSLDPATADANSNNTRPPAARPRPPSDSGAIARKRATTEAVSRSDKTAVSFKSNSSDSTVFFDAEESPTPPRPTPTAASSVSRTSMQVPSGSASPQDSCQTSPSSFSTEDESCERNGVDSKKLRIEAHAKPVSSESGFKPSPESGEVFSSKPTSSAGSMMSRSRQDGAPGDAARRGRARRLHLPRPRKGKDKVYQGRFLVQERQADSRRPTVSEIDSPLETTLVKRWKECAVFASLSHNQRKPLRLSFYDNVPETKLLRRSKRWWSHSLEKKLSLNIESQIALFSPLDLTLAIWRPGAVELAGTKDHGHRNKDKTTRVTIIHSQSLTEIMDLALLVASVTRVAHTLHGRSVLTMGVPYLDLHIELEIRQSFGSPEDQLDKARVGLSRLVPYRDLLGPVASPSPTIQALMETAWNSVSSLPAKLRMSTTDPTLKFALAWQLTGQSQRPLWMRSTADEIYPTTRLSWLMRSHNTLQMLQPLPKCREGDLEEPPALEGYSQSITSDWSYHALSGSLHGKGNIFQSQSLYLHTHDHYLLYSKRNTAIPPMLASGQGTLEKFVEPYPLDRAGNIKWVETSTCLREVDHHDAIAKDELSRRTLLLKGAKGLIDLMYVSSAEVAKDKDEEVHLLCDKRPDYRIKFDSKTVAKQWAYRVNELIKYWKTVNRGRSIRRRVGSAPVFGITPYLKNRSIVYSGHVFMKHHRFATFRACMMLLTRDSLVIFRLDKSTPPLHPYNAVPSIALAHRKESVFDLNNTYVYTGHLAAHALLDDDKHLDSSNPGVRALPRAYDDGWISQDTELDRCFVVWYGRRSRLSRAFSSTGTGNYCAFLARETLERDQWVSAIRYVQTDLAAETPIDHVVFSEEDDPSATAEDDQQPRKSTASD